MDKECKVYEYEGKFYSETDRSLEFEDSDWGGDLYDLHWDMKNDGRCAEETIYHIEGDYENTWSSAEEMIEDAFDFLVIDEDDLQKVIKEQTE